MIEVNLSRIPTMYYNKFTFLGQPYLVKQWLPKLITYVKFHNLNTAGFESPLETFHRVVRLETTPMAHYCYLIELA